MGKMLRRAICVILLMAVSFFAVAAEVKSDSSSERFICKVIL